MMSTVHNETRANWEEQLAGARAGLREELEAAWSMRVARAEEMLREGVGAELEALVGARLEEVRTEFAGERRRWEEAKAAEVAAAAEGARGRAAAAATGRLNECARRLRAAENHEEWSGALYDAAAGFAARAAVFTLHGRFLHLDRAPYAATLEDMPLTDAPAMREACEGGEPVVALYATQELSGALVAAFGEGEGKRAQLYPVMVGGKAVGVLYAEGGRGECDGNALELLATLAGVVWESRRESREERHGGPQLVMLQPAAQRVEEAVGERALGEKAVAVKSEAGPLWSQMPAEDRDHHLRAQRFARVRVAEMRLYKSALVLEGRRGRNLYEMLREEIDRGREEYREQHLMACESMVDYFHAEIVKTLANEDESLLGEGYPGALV